MIRHLKRYFAIRAYVTRLSGELARRFGVRSYYTVEQVSQAAERGGFTPAFLAYAHAIYCSRPEFDGYYQALDVACTYDGLRAVVARRYFQGSVDFDGASVVRAFRRSTSAEEDHFHESGEGRDNWS